MDKKQLLTLFTLLLGAAYLLPIANVYAAGGGVKPPHQDWSFNGAFGTYDRAALQRGFKVYKEVCSACHGMKHLYYRNLAALGYTENQVKNIAAADYERERQALSTGMKRN